MKTCIIVLGMHRSGTSALTGTLEKIGIMLPQDLWPAQEDNPKGFFEGQKVIELNERLLAANDSNYDDTRFNTKISEESIDQHLDETKSFLQEEFSYSKCFALKDPRMCITFPLWERALLELGIEIKVVIPYRNPFEVARSLKKRNNFSTEKSLLLWAKHLLLAEKYSRNYSRYFIGFNGLMGNTASILPELAKFAGVELSQNAITTVQEQFLDPTLKHHNLDINNVAENIPEFIHKLILFTQNERFANVKEEEWNAIFNEMTALYQFFHSYDVQFQSQISRDLHAQRDQARAQAHSFEEQLAQQVELKQSHIVALESEKGQLLERQSQLEQEAELLLQDLDSLKKQGQTANQALQEREQQLGSVQEQLSALEQSYAQQVEQSQSQIQVLKSEKDQLLERQSQLEQEAEQLLQDLDSIKEAKQAQKDELQSQIDRLSAEKGALNEETQRLVQQLKEQEQIADQALQDREQQLRAVQEQLSDLEQSQVQQAEQSEVQIEILKQKNNQLLERESQLEQEAEQLLQDLDSVKEAKQGQKDELQGQIDRLSTEKATLHEELHRQEQQLREQMLSSEQTLQEKDQQLSDLKQSYTLQIEESQAQINALESENSELLKRRDELSQEVNSLTESIDTVVQDLDILKKQKKSSSIYSILGFSKFLKGK